MKNTIAERIADFLKDFPPFNQLQNEALFEICTQIEVIHIEKDEIVFEAGEELQQFFFVVKDGAIGIVGEDNTVLDHCDEGDIFGLRALLRNIGKYQLSAKALEESIVYRIATPFFEKHIATNPKASKYLMASFASNALAVNNENIHEAIFADQDILRKEEQHVSEMQTINYSKNPVQCTPQTSIQEAANIMTDKMVGSIVVVDNELPAGIITDKDFRYKIATGNHLITEPVTNIMSSPVLTFASDLTLAEAQVAMLENRISHLCITETGKADSPLLGILSEHDIIVVRGNNPSALIKEIYRATNDQSLLYIKDRAQELLQQYLGQAVRISFITKIMTAINDALTRRSIELSISEMEQEPPVAFAWLSLGSQGRKEQLLRTDQDNALVFANVEASEYDLVQKYFVSLAEKVNKKLHTIGFEYCPAEMMASNPKWCLSVKNWQQQFHHWISEPTEDNIMLSTIFFDYRMIFGEQDLVNQMTKSIFKSIDGYEIFLNFLGRNALTNPPPLSFFRTFLVEASGEHKDQFDLKLRAMMPLVDAARLLVLSKKIPGNNSTISRLRRLSEEEPQNKKLYDSCIKAFRILLRFRTIEGLEHGDSGRYIDIKNLSKRDKLKLKNCFKPIKDLQELLKVRFSLAQMT
ncbi:MAG: DUF294 nucleotidyltransferase-like domain-containing protein [Flavobacteriaceae bacterium]|nr:DUF294 nucleotidyltransferase-like domain-containing protein [Flavobacteriaceae bacterium]